MALCFSPDFSLLDFFCVYPMMCALAGYYARKPSPCEREKKFFAQRNLSSVAGDEQF